MTATTFAPFAVGDLVVHKADIRRYLYRVERVWQIPEVHPATGVPLPAAGAWKVCLDDGVRQPQNRVGLHVSTTYDMASLYVRAGE
jgi:hypothetical protein